MAKRSLRRGTLEAFLVHRVQIMGQRGAAIIIEPRLLVCEALELLMENHSYRVVCAVRSTADIASRSIVADDPTLVIMGAQSTDTAVTEADGIRKLWPDSKIVLLLENASPADFQKLLTSQIDGCIPLFVSPDTLISTLDLIMIRDVRVLIVGDTKRLWIPLAQEEESQQPAGEMDKPQSASIEHHTISITSPRNVPHLSGREAQILDCLVKGHANKMIARTCDITEATVKVHMKSILRKIGVGNRTQAALWALEHGSATKTIDSRQA